MPLPIDYNVVADLYDDYVTVRHDIPFFLEEARQRGGKGSGAYLGNRPHFYPAPKI